VIVQTGNGVINDNDLARQICILLKRCKENSERQHHVDTQSMLPVVRYTTAPRRAPMV
jgi:hypothetical protein